MNLENMTQKAIDIINLTRQDIFLDYLGQSMNLPTQLKGEYELVTEADERSSDFIIGQLEKTFPGIPAISEESPDEAFTNIPGRFWLIDPLDGTTNFIRGIRYASISVSLVETGEPVIGITENIYNGDLFHAYQGGGLFYNGSRIHRKVNKDGMRILSTGFPHNKSLHTQHWRNLTAVFPHFTDIRRMASFCLDMCALCEGKLDASFEIVKPWDFYAGLAMAKEVGLSYHMTDAHAPWNHSRYFICGEPELVDIIRNASDLSLDQP